MCYNGGVCDDKTGKCICPPGFKGPNCVTACPAYSFGWNCEFRCGGRNLFGSSCNFVQFSLPDPFGISCISGRYGSGCSSGCPTGRFGADCLQECHCMFADNGCNSTTGVCNFGGCTDGWLGTNCQIPDVCPVGYYGLNCASMCHCNGKAACDKHTGYCSGRCAPGSTCVSWQCDSGYFGEDCSKACYCKDDTPCDAITGSCRSGLCLEQYQSDGTGICQFLLPVLSQPPKVEVDTTSATVRWEAWGSHPMDAGDGPVIEYTIYRSNPSTGSWVRVSTVQAKYQPPEGFSFLIDPLQQLTVYNFSVAAVREGDGGEGPRSPETTIRTEPQAMTIGTNIGLIVAVCALIAVIVIVVVVDYLRFRRFSKRLRPKSHSIASAVNMNSLAAYDNPLADDIPRNSVTMEGYDDVGNDANDGADAATTYEEVDLPWTKSLTVPIDQLSLGVKVIGTGHFGEVRLATVLLSDGHLKAAVKQLQVNAPASENERFLEEYRTLKDIGTHPNIVRMLAVAFHEDVLYVALEYLSNGDLRTYLRGARPDGGVGQSSLSDAKLLQFAFDVAKGMQHIAASGVIHRKVAAASILLDENMVPKISGFGLARCAEVIVEKPKKLFPPPRWMALESLKTNTFTSKSDVWSFGILLWEISSVGATPYAGIKSTSLGTRFENGYRLPKPDSCNDEIYGLMQQCWQENPKDRPPFKKVASILEGMAKGHKQQRYIQMSPRSETPHYLNIRPDQDDK
ncbi:tyrosine-protein kinase receptor Tie-1-like [Acanthaster planci]|uniref:Tyrosine-protein kinase receptor Tie-1-like n=1 Tax=Acanthaster planci TaxID=133434 RepID=A0A8B7YX81_ACAPL|nr:tyrosine-protein kinase receptor Tie-1-like [Acanthaster planci]